MQQDKSVGATSEENCQIVEGRERNENSESWMSPATVRQVHIPT